MSANWTQADLDAHYQRLKQDPDSVPFIAPPESPCLTLYTGEPIVIAFVGRHVGKKNAYSPRKDRPGLFKNSKLQAKLDAFALQIPAKFRDLKLKHCDVDFHFTYEGTSNWDRDNFVTALIDVLVEYGVLAGDQVSVFNGRVTIHPAVKSEDGDLSTVVLTPRHENHNG